MTANLATEDAQLEMRAKELMQSIESSATDNERQDIVQAGVCIWVWLKSYPFGWTLQGAKTRKAGAEAQKVRRRRSACLFGGGG